MNDYIIDRKTARQLFQELLHNQNPCCVLWLYGHGKMGKTHLLKRFHRSAIKKKIPSAYLRLEENYANVGTVLNKLKLQLDGSERTFPEYQRVVAKHGGYSVRIDMKDTQLDDHSNVVVNQGGKDPRTNQMQDIELTNAFLHDLARFERRKRKLLLLDALDKSDQQIREWVQGHLIIGLHRIDKVLVVLAGREKPNLSPPWEYDCHSHELQPVTIQDYLEFCKQMELNLPQETIEAFHAVYKGSPGQFSEAFIDLQAYQQGRAG